MSGEPSNRQKGNKVEVGPTLFVQACAQMMSAAWIRHQIHTTSTAQGLSISGIAYAMRYTFATQIGFAFELALKSVEQGLSETEDGQGPQVTEGHDLEILWNALPCPVRKQIDEEAESLGRQWFPHADDSKALLPLGEWLKKHQEFLRHAKRRYAIKGDQWRSEHRFVTNLFLSFKEGENGIDGLYCLIAYWAAIMSFALGLRWEAKRCEANADLAADREEAKNLLDRSVDQMRDGPVPYVAPIMFRRGGESRFQPFA